jgi:hypothetical protein
MTCARHGCEGVNRTGPTGPTTTPGAFMPHSLTRTHESLLRVHGMHAWRAQCPGVTHARYACSAPRSAAFRGTSSPGRLAVGGRGRGRGREVADSRTTTNMSVTQSHSTNTKQGQEAARGSGMPARISIRDFASFRGEYR